MLCVCFVCSQLLQNFQLPKISNTYWDHKGPNFWNETSFLPSLSPPCGLYCSLESPFISGEFFSLFYFLISTLSPFLKSTIDSQSDIGCQWFCHVTASCVILSHSQSQSLNLSLSFTLIRVENSNINTPKPVPFADINRS